MYCCVRYFDGHCATVVTRIQTLRRQPICECARNRMFMQDYSYIVEMFFFLSAKNESDSLCIFVVQFHHRLRNNTKCVFVCVRQKVCYCHSHFFVIMHILYSHNSNFVIDTLALHFEIIQCQAAFSLNV